MDRRARQRNAARRACAMLAAGAALLAYRVSRAERDDRPPEPDVEVLRVEAVRTAELPETPSSFASVIDVEAYAGENKSVEALLEQAVGVQVRRFGGAGQQSEISIRGSNGRQVVILLDGVRINSAQSGSVDLSTIPRDLIERIEVVRGGGSLQTGSAAIGGVVNIVTRSASPEPTTSLALSRGSFETWEVSGSQTGRLAGADLALGYEFFRSEGDWEFEPLPVAIGGVPLPPDEADAIQRINNQSHNHAGLVKLGRDVGDRLRLELSDQLFYGEGGRPGLDQPEGGALHGQSFSAQARRARNVTDLRARSAGWRPGQLELELRLFHRYERNRFEDPTPPTGVPLDSDDRDTSLGASFDVRGELALGPTGHAPSAGLRIQRDALDSRQTGDHERRALGAFLQDEIAGFRRRVRLVPGIGFDDTEGFGAQWLPRVGAVIEPVPWLRIRANAERAYRAPNFNELYFNEGSLRGNPALRPEESRNYDVGLELAFEKLGPLGGLSLEAAGFYNDIDDSIVFQPVSSNVVAATNTGRARIRGVELAASLQLADWLALSGNWTRLDSEVRSTGKPLPGRPEQEYLLRLELGPASGLFKLVGERRFTDEIPANAGGALVLRERAVYDASAALDLARIRRLGERLGLRGLLLSVSGTNLGDISVRDAQAFPQPGRAITGRIEVRR